MTRGVTRSRAVAAHEAAHVVVGVHFGLTLDRVAIKDDGKLVGFTDFEDHGERVLADVLCDAAGPAWEALAGRRGAKWRGDYDIANLRRAGWSEPDIRLLIALARQYLEGPGRVAHELVTRALLERDLTGADVAAILSGDE